MDFPENLKVIGFDYLEKDIYSLLHRLGESIHQPLSILEYFQVEEDIGWGDYALYYAELSYFNTEIYLIKNFKWTSFAAGTLFENQLMDKEYIIATKPPKMFLMMIYSDEIKTKEDVERFIAAEKLRITNLSMITFKKLISQLHNSIQAYSIQKEKLELKDNEILSLQNKLNHFQSAQQDYKQEIISLKLNLTEKEEEINELTEEVETYKNNIQTLTAENQLMQSQIDALIDQLDKSVTNESDTAVLIDKSVVDELQSNYNNILSEYQQLKELTDTQQKTILSLQQNIELLISENQNLQSTIQSLQTELEKLVLENQSLTSLAPNLEKLNLEKSSYLKEIQHIFNEKSHLADERDKLKNEIQSLKNQVSTLQELESINKTLEEQVVQLQTMMDTLQTEFVEYKNKSQITYDELLNEYNILLEENEQLQSELNIAQNQIQLLQEELNETISKQNNRVEEFKALVAEQQSKINQYENQMEEFQLSANQYKNQIEEYQKQVHHLKTELLNVLNIQDVLVHSLRKIQNLLTGIYSNENQTLNISNLDAHRKSTIFAGDNQDTLIQSVNELNTQLTTLFNEKLN